MEYRPSRVRFPLIALAALSLLAALWYGFVRLGWQVSLARPEMMLAHGPLMVAGFLGTLIGVERAVALQKRAAYLAPLATGSGALALLAGLPVIVSRGLMTLGSAGLLLIFVLLLWRYRALFTLTMTLGAAAWLAGDLFWLTGAAIPTIVLWWMGFLVLSVAGERLELSRVRRLSRTAVILFALALALFVAGMIVTRFVLDAGSRVAGLGLLALAAWLLRFDVATRTIRSDGLPRFIAACLLAGYGWLAAGGLLLAVVGAQFGGMLYDAALHAVFLGFIFSVIFGHAPIILPGVLGTPQVFNRLYYGHLALLHASLALRIVSDLSGWMPGRKWGGLLNITALLLFLVVTAASVFLARRQHPSSNPS